MRFPVSVGACAAVACLLLAGAPPVSGLTTAPAGVVFAKILFDFSDSSYAWANLTVSNPTAFNSTWNATRAAAAGAGIWLKWSWSASFGVFVQDIGNRSAPCYAGLYKWNTSAKAWDFTSTGISNLTLRNGDSIALSNCGYAPITFQSLFPIPTPLNPEPSIQFRAGSNNEGVSASAAPAGVSLLWDRALGIQQIEATPAIAYGRVFVLTQNGMWALDESTGFTVWSNSSARGLSSPAIWNGELFFGGKDGRLHCLNAANGVEIWNRTLITGPTISGITSSPKVLFDTLYVGAFNESGGTGAVFALWATNGTIRWRYSNATLGSVDFSSPAIVDGTAYVGIMGRYNTTTSVTFDPPYGVLALNASTGARRWFRPTGGSVAASVVVTGSVVYAPAKDGLVYAINASNGTLLWSTSAQAGVSSAALHDGVLYLGGGAYGGTGSMEALRLSGPQPIWSVGVNGPVQASVTYADGLVLGATNTAQGTIYALDSATGIAAWTYTPSPADYIFASPVAADGMILATSDSGHVFALQAASQPLLNLTVTAPPSVAANALTTLTVNITAPFGAARSVQVALFLDGLTFVSATWPGASQPAASESWNLSLVSFRSSHVNRITVRGNCAVTSSAPSNAPGCLSLSAKATVIVQYTDVQGTPQSSLTQVVPIDVVASNTGVDWLAIGVGTAAGAAIVAAAVVLMFQRRKRKEEKGRSE